jgi:hypothetical protein
MSFSTFVPAERGNGFELEIFVAGQVAIRPDRRITLDRALFKIGQKHKAVNF